MSGRPKFSVIMPAFNEAGHLAVNIDETVAVMEQLGESYEIIPVDDGSRDRSADVLRQAAARHASVKPVLLTLNQGKGYALRAGFTQAEGELIFFLDADLDLHPKQFGVLYQIMAMSHAAIVIGSKRHPMSVLHYPGHRRFISTVYFFLIKLLFGLPIRDTQTGIKLFRREALEKIFPKILVKKYAFDLELLVLAHHYGYKIAEAPVVVDYKAKFGRIGAKAIFNIWWDTMAVWYRLAIRRYYDKVVHE